jgi:predicted SAM-dependent methyltransferase
MINRARRFRIVNTCYYRVAHWYEFARAYFLARLATPLKVVIGAGHSQLEGWLLTDKKILDITRPGSWRRLFSPASIDCLLAEHVLEHLSLDECRIALREAYRYLKPGGVFRIAVPDGNRRDPDYVAETAPPMHEHQVLFTLETLSALLEEAGFTVQPLEYFDKDDQFHACPWDVQGGHIQRSVRFDRQVAFRRGDLYYTSLIVDAIKH